MKTVLIHGDDTAKSYTRYKQILSVTKKRGWEIVMLEKSDKLNLEEHLSAGALFDGEDGYFTEKLFVLNKPKDIHSKTFDWIRKNAQNLNSNLLIYLNSPAPATLIKQLPRDTTKEVFMLPKLLFKFLDEIYPGNSKTALNMLHKITESEAIEMVMAMLARHLRDLYWAQSDPDTLPYPSWRASKLKSQAAKFKNHSLTNLIRNLADIDTKSKSSKLDLGTALDLTLIKYLQ
jgi:DNA polymerase III delta subunit